MATTQPRKRSTFQRRWRNRARVAETMVLLSVGTALQRWVPMTAWAPVLGHAQEVPARWQGNSISQLPVRANDGRERTAAASVLAAARKLPWHSSCLAEAFAGQVLLRQSGAGGVVVIGLRATDQGPWDAHAWLLGRRGALTGGPAAKGFTPVTVFATRHGLRAENVDLDLGPVADSAAADERSWQERGRPHLVRIADSHDL